MVLRQYTEIFLVKMTDEDMGKMYNEHSSLVHFSHLFKDQLQRNKEL